MKELQFLVEHHLYRQQQGGGDECSSESCLSDRPSPDSVPVGEELPHDDEATVEAFEKLRCQMEEFSRESLLEGGEGGGALECPLATEKDRSSPASDADPSSQQSTQTDANVSTSTSSSQSAEDRTKKSSMKKK